MLRIAEIFRSIQGEGHWAGKQMHFVRLAGCNATPAFSCWGWCDTKYARAGGKDMSVDDILAELNRLPSATTVCLTGGEPLTQPIAPLTTALQAHGWRVHLETNGTLPVPEDAWLDWIAVSPKLPWDHLNYDHCDEIKLVLAEGETPDVPDYVEDRAEIFLQPCDNDPANIAWCIRLLEEHPSWRLSLQLHKIIAIR